MNDKEKYKEVLKIYLKNSKYKKIKDYEILALFLSFAESFIEYKELEEEYKQYYKDIKTIKGD